MAILQLPEAESSQIPMLYPEGIKRANMGLLKPPNRTLPLAETTPEEITPPEGKEATTWINSWHHIDQ